MENFIDEDEFVEKSISSNVVILDGQVSVDHFGSTGFLAGNGVDYAIILKASTAYLDIFEFMPESKLAWYWVKIFRGAHIRAKTNALFARKTI